MTGEPVEIPRHLVEVADRWFAADGYGRRWLAELPALVRRLSAQWRLELGATYRGGSHALVVEATRSGRPLVLKVPLRDDENRYEAQALRAYAGEGAVRLFEFDGESGAMLLERAAAAPLSEHPDGDAAALLVLCGLLRRLRCTPPGDVPFPRVVDIARRWSGMLSGALDGMPADARPMIGAAVALADEYAGRPDGPTLLINRDAHPGNVLSAEREPWLLIDPKPLVGEAAFEAGHPLLNRLGVPRGLDGSSATALSAAAGVDPGTGSPYVNSLHAGFGTPQRVVELAALLGRGLGADPQRVRGWALIRAAENAVWGRRAGADISGDLAQLAAVYAAGVPAAAAAPAG